MGVVIELGENVKLRKIMNAGLTQKHALFHYDVGRDFPVMVCGDGIYLYEQDGNRFIDAAAGVFNVIIGHGCKRIAEAIAEQAETLAFAFSAHFTNQPALDLADRIAAVSPGDLNNVSFVCGGSEGVETAMKIAHHYHVQRGNADTESSGFPLARLPRRYDGSNGRYRFGFNAESDRFPVAGFSSYRALPSLWVQVRWL